MGNIIRVNAAIYETYRRNGKWKLVGSQDFYVEVSLMDYSNNYDLVVDTIKELLYERSNDSIQYTYSYHCVLDVKSITIPTKEFEEKFAKLKSNKNEQAIN